MGATQGGNGTFGLPELEPQEGVKQRYYHPTPLNAWMKPCVHNVRCFTCKIDYDIFVQNSALRVLSYADHLAAAGRADPALPITDAGYEPVTMQMSKEAANERDDMEKPPEPLLPIALPPWCCAGAALVVWLVQGAVALRITPPRQGMTEASIPIESWQLA